MSIYLQTNTASLVSEQNLQLTTQKENSTFTQLSSGYRINSAADDAASLGIAKKMNAQIQSFSTASQNTSDSISMVQTADGGADQIDTLLTRMRQLAVEATNGTMSSDDISNINSEYQDDLSEINRVASDTTFNGKVLLDGSQGTVNFQVGINASSADQIAVNFSPLTSDGLYSGAKTNGFLAAGVGAPALTGSKVNDTGILQTLDAAMAQVASVRAGFGANINRLTDANNAITSTSTNLSSALGAIQDVDVAQATSDLSRQQVLAQAGASVLAQANQVSQLALKLLQ
jgi:flagellin